ncbi:hypothetical protein [Zymomonas mobilis]|uniref:hypothetical protein n=1 Tax=Zymomonas mobilis TaxID=542 RepID=UPI00243293D9|nr:hypothetical protein [Zymomonas mobilis]
MFAHSVSRETRAAHLFERCLFLFMWVGGGYGLGRLFRVKLASEVVSITRAILEEILL